MTVVLLVVGLIVLGLTLIALEILVVQGGIVGALGVVSVVASMVIAYSELGGTTGFFAIGGGVAATALAFWLLPRTRAARSMILDAQQQGTAADPKLRELVDRRGVALTPLRPSGTVKIDGSPVDVVTGGEYVDAGKRVKVTEVEGGRVVVKPID